MLLQAMVSNGSVDVDNSKNLLLFVPFSLTNTIATKIMKNGSIYLYLGRVIPVMKN